MKVNNSVSRSFTAKFLENDDIKEIVKEEVKAGRKDALEETLNKLSKTHTNCVLVLEKQKDHITVTNMYNNNKTEWTDFSDNTRELKELANPLSINYYKLFVKGQKLSEANVNRTTESISKKYFTNYIPDYALGKKIDQTI